MSANNIYLYMEIFKNKCQVLITHLGQNVGPDLDTIDSDGIPERIFRKS